MTSPAPGLYDNVVTMRGQAQMGRRKKKFDAVAFKDEMQRLSEERLAGVPPEERLQRIREAVESGPLGEWWKGLPRAPARRRRGTSAR